MMTRHQRAAVDGFSIFYREAGSKEAPAILLLHGFPTSSHMFHNLIPLLADRYHLVAPDLPGFGFTDAPGRDRFRYTFENLTKSVDGFTETLRLNRFATYVFDYLAPENRSLANELSRGPRLHERWGPGSADGISGMDLHGGPITPNSLNGGEAPFPEFHDVYIERENLLYYQHHGNFPDGTVLVKELALAQKGKYPDGSLDSASGRGYFPSELHGIDVMVKDSNRFANTNKWGSFTFGHRAPP